MRNLAERDQTSQPNLPSIKKQAISLTAQGTHSKLATNLKTDKVGVWLL